MLHIETVLFFYPNKSPNTKTRFVNNNNSSEKLLLSYLCDAACETEIRVQVNNAWVKNAEG